MSSSDPIPTKKYQAVLLFGGPGSGKGTQGKLLGDSQGFLHSASGEILRKLDPESQMGKISASFLSRGELVPDQATLSIWTNAIHVLVKNQNYKPGEQILVLDGIPRTVVQAKLLEAYIDVLGIIHLNCADREAMFKRIRGRALRQGRVDDADESIIRRRWEVYETQTKPVLAHYPDELIHSIDAMGSVEQIQEQVLSVVTPLRSRLSV
jgi:adenylate kinase